ncbi:MAG: hypothetical protein ACSLFP_10870 [Acidimicrobiales bacterium]
MGGDEQLDDLSDMSSMGTSPPSGPVISPRGSGASGWLVAVVGLTLTLAAVALVVLVLAGGDDDESTPEAVATDSVPAPSEPTTTQPGGGLGEPSQQPSTTVPAGPADLFGGDLPAAVTDLEAAAGGPTEVISLSVYPDYAFLAYRDPVRTDDIDRRLWRDRAVGEAESNPIDDRVDADTAPSLFRLSEVDLALLPGLVADAATRYDRPVVVTHVIIDRFLPFDERVLIRIYATPTDGRSGGGYVSYDAAGALVDVCC